MISKIITTGQTGTGRAALDVAIEMDISYERGTLEREDCSLLEKNHMKQKFLAPDEEQRETNIKNSHGTLIVSRGELKGGPALTRELAGKNKRPWLHADLEESAAFCHVARVTRWIFDHKIDILNVEGPSSSESPKIYADTVKLLKAIFFIDIGELYRPCADWGIDVSPITVEEAVDTLMTKLSLKERVNLSKMKEKELPALNHFLGQYIKRKYGLRSKGSELMRSCRLLLKQEDLREDGASALIIHELWTRLKKTHALRIVRARNSFLSPRLQG